jgi:hypothetical protein
MKIRVYNEKNDHRASFKTLSEACGFMEFLGDGATIRYAKGVKSILFTEGEDDSETMTTGEKAKICQKRYKDKFTLEA